MYEMPTLMGLPNEILISIIDATGPEDVVSFSTCCKTMYSLAKRRLEEHKEKQRLFANIFVNGDFLPYPGPFRGVKYSNSDTDTDLNELFSDERNHSYPKAMLVKFDLEEFGPTYEHDGWRPARLSATNWFDEFQHQLKSRMAEIHSMMALVVGGIEAEKWVKDVKEGYPLATFLLLLALLPNLEKCEIQIFSWWRHTLSAKYSKIIRLLIEAALGQKENGLSLGGRLTKCIIYGDYCGSIRESFLPFIMMLPKMRTIQASRLDIENVPWPFTDAVSPIADLDLNGVIHTATLSNYVRGIRELKSFRYNYENDSFMDFPDISWEPCEIVATLRQTAFKSLVSLDLTTSVTHDWNWFDISPGIGSLRSFEVLEIVRLEYVLLLEEVLIADGADEVDSKETSGILNEESLAKAQGLIDFLPSTARIVQLEGIPEGEGSLDAFKGFPEHRVERLPRLDSMVLNAEDETISQIEKICKETGVQITQLLL